jgi:hypothetical protein
MKGNPRNKGKTCKFPNCKNKTSTRGKGRGRGTWCRGHQKGKGKEARLALIPLIN